MRGFLIGPTALLSMALCFLPASPAGAVAVAEFNGGNSTAVVDAFEGTAGDGWISAWNVDLTRSTTTSQVMASGMTGHSPLGADSGNYLDVAIQMDATVTDSNQGQACVGRTYTSYDDAFNAAMPHTIEFSVRIDENLGSGTTFTNNLDRYYFFDSPASRSGTSAENAWAIFGFGANYGTSLAKKWAFYDGQQDGGAFNENLLVNTGMAITAGTTYTFTIDVDPANRTYNASVFNGATTVSVADLGFRTSAAAVGRTLLFGGKGNTPADQRAFSLDSVQVLDNGSSTPTVLPTADGFRGIWYYNQWVGAPYNYKYSGGFGTYPQQIDPFAYYAEEADKTFFVFGGTDESNSTLYHMISYYDHETGQVARPRILMDKGTTDAHDNPCLMLDDQGYIYIFSNAHGTGRPSFISRGAEPYSIDSFQTVLSLPAGADNNFSYGQPFYVEGQGFLFLHSLYTSDSGRTLRFNTSSDGIHWDYAWTDRPAIAEMPGGQYQVSNMSGQKVGTAFNYHPGGQVNARTNLYYMETSDMGQTWTTAGGTVLTTPVTTVTNAALVRDYQSEGLLVFLKDVQYDAQGNPILFYLTSHDWEPGPDGDPRMFHTAHWDDGQWIIRDAFATDHNYDFGPLYVESDGTWRIIAPTDPGPQEYCTGGEMVMWISEDEGATWTELRQLTHDSVNNHTYARQPVNVNDGFYSFWADGNALAKSESHFYFTDRLGTGVWMLPETMEGDFATPELVYLPLGAPAPGDANGDGVVDDLDAQAVAQHWLKASGAIWSDGDFNRDGRVDDRDAAILAAHWVRGGSEGQSPAVPEPGPLTLASALLATLLAVRPMRTARAFQTAREPR